MKIIEYNNFKIRPLAGAMGAEILDVDLKNINDDTFNNIWCSERRLEHSDFIFNDLNISECRVNCRMDQVNRYLDKVVNKTVDHINFI